MVENREGEIHLIIQSMMKDCGLITSQGKKNNLSDLRFSKLTGDGSSRGFYRVSLKGEVLCLAVAPGLTGNKNLEAHSTKLIGCHLHSVGVPVPAQYGYNREHGIVLFEDLGDTKLYDLIIKEMRTPHGIDVDKALPWYRQVIGQLVIMQVEGAKSFNPEWCWEGGCYNSQVMLERESGYFLRSFYQDVLSCSIPDGIEEEFVEIANV